MEKYYYTYGMHKDYPFQGGWTLVIAPSMEKAHVAFREKHPDKALGTLNCVACYSGEKFAGTGFPKKGNLGRKCLEVIFAKEARDGIFACYHFRINRTSRAPSREKKEVQMPWWCDAQEHGYSDITCFLPKDQDFLYFWDGAYDIRLEEV